MNVQSIALTLTDNKIIELFNSKVLLLFVADILPPGTNHYKTMLKSASVCLNMNGDYI